MSESKDKGARPEVREDVDVGHDGLSDQDDRNKTAESEPGDNADAGQEASEQLSLEELQTLLAETQEKVANYHDELLRARAEVENIRRRSQEEIAKARKFGIESFAESLVAVIDSLEAALGQPDQDAQAWQEGVEATLRQLVGAFERNAMAAVAPEAGDRFDPHLHQAISTVPSDQPEGAIVQRLQKGYTIAERVLRPALVIVSSGQAEPDKS